MNNVQIKFQLYCKSRVRASSQAICSAFFLILCFNKSVNIEYIFIHCIIYLLFIYLFMNVLKDVKIFLIYIIMILL